MIAHKSFTIQYDFLFHCVLNVKMLNKLNPKWHKMFCEKYWSAGHSLIELIESSFKVQFHTLIKQKFGTLKELQPTQRTLCLLSTLPMLMNSAPCR